MYRNFRTAVVLPIHNEAELLPVTVAALPALFDEIVLVDDASTDATPWVLGQIQMQTDRRVTVLRHAENRGVGAATVTGYRYVLRTRAEMVVLMDGDGQMDGNDVPRLLDALLDERLDFVKGNRFAHSSISTMPWTRYLGNRMFSWLTQAALGVAEPLDSQCGFTAFRTAGLRRLNLDDLFPRYGFPNDLLFSVAAAGLRFGNVPVRTIYGREVSGINPVVVLPTIGWLIARGYWRTFFAANTIAPSASLSVPASESDLGSS